MVFLLVDSTKTTFFIHALKFTEKFACVCAMAHRRWIETEGKAKGAEFVQFLAR